MKKSYICMAVLLMVATLSFADDISGKWSMTMETPRGERVQEIAIAQDGEKITVTSSNRQGEKSASAGTYKDGKISWSTTRVTPRGEFTMVYIGEVKDGAMSGTVDFGGRGNATWTATKVK